MKNVKNSLQKSSYRLSETELEEMHPLSGARALCVCVHVRSLQIPAQETSLLPLSLSHPTLSFPPAALAQTEELLVCAALINAPLRGRSQGPTTYYFYTQRNMQYANVQAWKNQWPSEFTKHTTAWNPLSHNALRSTWLSISCAVNELWMNRTISVTFCFCCYLIRDCSGRGGGKKHMNFYAKLDKKCEFTVFYFGYLFVRW